MSESFEASRRIRLLHAINRVFARVYHGLSVEGRCDVPRRGPAIVVANHISSLDPLLVQSVVRRPIIWMMAREYYDLPVLGWVFRAVQAIPVSRDGKDATSLRAALRTLSGGHVLGIFPEGRIEPTKELLPLQTGLALIALRAKAPIIPAMLDGTTRGTTMAGAFIRPHDVRLRFGPAVDLSKDASVGKSLELGTARIEAALRKLRSS